MDFIFQTSWVTLPVALFVRRPAARLPDVHFVGPHNSECEREAGMSLGGRASREGLDHGPLRGSEKFANRVNEIRGNGRSDRLVRSLTRFIALSVADRRQRPERARRTVHAAEQKLAPDDRRTKEKLAEDRGKIDLQITDLGSLPKMGGSGPRRTGHFGSWRPMRVLTSRACSRGRPKNLLEKCCRAAQGGIADLVGHPVLFVLQMVGRNFRKRPAARAA